MKLLFHLFSYGNKTILFDARTYAIAEVEPRLAEVLILLRDHSIATARKKFITKFSTALWDKYSADVYNLISEKLLLTEDDEYFSAPSLKRLVLLMTDGCNLACRYCFEKDRHGNYCQYRYMTQEVAETSLSYLFRHSPYSKVFVNLYGGEPLLNLKTIRYVVNKGKELSRRYQKEINWFLVTNGTLLNQEIACFIKKNKIGVQISIDGSKENQNEYRLHKNGKESYSLVAKNIKLLESIGVACNLMAVLHNKNASDTSWLDDLRSLVTGSVAFCVTASDDKTIIPSKSEWRHFLDEYKSYLNKLTSEIDKDGGHNHIATEMMNKIKNGRKFYYGCGGGLEEFTVMPDGEMYLCERLSGKLSCNIANDTPPAELWQKYINDVTNTKCKKCWAKYLCGGGCAHTFYVHNRAKVPYEWHCKVKNAEIETAISMICKKFHYNSSIKEG